MLQFLHLLAFANDKRAPDIHFAVCQQHYPENFWNPAFQQHANGARGIAGVIVVAKAPELHRGFYETFAGSPATPATGGFAVATARGMIEVLTPDTFSKRFGVAPPEASRSARLAALCFAVPPKLP